MGQGCEAGRVPYVGKGVWRFSKSTSLVICAQLWGLLRVVDVVLMEWALSPLGPPLLEKLRALLPMVPPKTSLLPLSPVEFTTAGRGEGLISAHTPATLPPAHLPVTAAPPCPASLL